MVSSQQLPLASKLLGMIHCVLLFTLVVPSAAFSSSSTARLGDNKAWQHRRVIPASAKHARHDGEKAPPSVSAHREASFFVREVREEDLGAAANILAESFSSDGANSNFLARRVERMNTYLSLKSRFETFRYAERSGSLQCMLVACSALDENEVVGFCEVDNRPPGGEINPAPRPYISNLAVDEKFRRQGTASMLVSTSEEIVRGWGKPKLYLRVNDENDGAKAMYCGCGYEFESNFVNAEGETVMLLGKTL